jgi:hypothetical protein
MSVAVSADSWENIIHLLLSRRTGVKLLGGMGLFLVIAFGGGLERVSQALGRGVNPTLPVLVLLVISIATSVVVMDSLGGLWSSIKTGYTNKAAEGSKRRAEAAAYERIRMRAMHILPELGQEALAALQKLNRETLCSMLHSDLTEELEGIGVIIREERLTRISSLFRLHPAAQPIVAGFFLEQRHREITSGLSEASEAAKDFLRLYLMPSPASHEHPDHPFLSPSLYAGAEELVRAKVLMSERPPRGVGAGPTIRVPDDVVTAIEELLGTSLRRKAIRIDYNLIGSSVDSGSGLRGSL